MIVTLHESGWPEPGMGLKYVVIVMKQGRTGFWCGTASGPHGNLPEDILKQERVLMKLPPGNCMRKQALRRTSYTL